MSEHRTRQRARRAPQDDDPQMAPSRAPRHGVKECQCQRPRQQHCYELEREHCGIKGSPARVRTAVCKSEGGEKRRRRIDCYWVFPQEKLCASHVLLYLPAWLAPCRFARTFTPHKASTGKRRRGMRRTTIDQRQHDVQRLHSQVRECIQSQPHNRHALHPRHGRKPRRAAWQRERRWRSLHHGVSRRLAASGGRRSAARSHGENIHKKRSLDRGR